LAATVEEEELILKRVRQVVQNGYGQVIVEVVGSKVTFVDTLFKQKLV
jgi:hypothetical protein